MNDDLPRAKINPAGVLMSYCVLLQLNACRNMSVTGENLFT